MVVNVLVRTVVGCVVLALALMGAVEVVLLGRALWELADDELTT